MKANRWRRREWEKRNPVVRVARFRLEEERNGRRLAREEDDDMTHVPTITETPTQEPKSGKTECTAWKGTRATKECPDHRALRDSSGRRVLYCSRCGYDAPKDAKPPELRRRDLRYPLDYVVEQIHQLPPECQEHYEETLEITTESGWWDDETRQRYAFARMVDEMLAPEGGNR